VYSPEDPAEKVLARMNWAEGRIFRVVDERPYPNADVLSRSQSVRSWAMDNICKKV
jgi:hypothetical protein